MSKDHNRTNRALDALLADDADMSEMELRTELSAQGVNVDEFLARFSKTVRKAYQQQVRTTADKANDEARSAKVTLFGDLARKGIVELRTIRDQVLNGDFGSELQNTAIARCRHQQGTELSEGELRSWLEDISATAPER